MLGRACALWVELGLLLALGGCADAHYERVRLGAPPAEYDSVLPAEHSRRTALGICYLQRDQLGRSDSIVLLVTQDRRVAAKLQATLLEPQSSGWQRAAGPPRAGYRLVAEVDSELTELRSAGPLDILRALCAELTDYEGEKIARESHALVAAGLVRLLQRWPGVSDPGVDTQALAEALRRVPGGGESQIAVDGRGVYRYRYAQGDLR